MARRRKTEALQAKPKTVVGAKFIGAPSKTTAPKPKKAFLVPFDAQYDSGPHWHPNYGVPDAIADSKILGPAGAPCPLLNTAAQISKVIDMISALPTTEIPALYIDLEGENLSKDGTIAIFQLYIAPLSAIVLLDIHKLGALAFSATGSDGSTTLKHILESKTIVKVLFDCRNDSNALTFLYGVNLRGVADLQVMRSCIDLWVNERLKGLATCIKKDGVRCFTDVNFVEKIKDTGNRLFAPDRGGSYSVFTQRPLSLDMVRYCAIDVVYMPTLWSKYNDEIRSPGGHTTSDGRYNSALMLRNIDLATKVRVLRSQTAAYLPVSKCKVTAPWARWCYLKGEACQSHECEAVEFVQVKRVHDEEDLLDRATCDVEKVWGLASGESGEAVQALAKWVEEVY